MRLVVLGDPVDHSLSPLLHTAAMRAAGLIGTYERRRVDGPGVEQAVAEIRRGELDGANVTMPHKELAAALCDRLGTTARRTGAVNTLLRSGQSVVGHNTDVGGIRSAWDAAGLPNDGPVLILGAGGAAAAALIALEGRDLAMSARRPEAAAAVCARVGVAAAVVPWGRGASAHVVVNATPLGMHGEELPSGVLAGATGLFEMAYGAAPTPATESMHGRGLPVADGRAMLLHQAARAFELWTGHPAPIDAMAAAL